MYTRFVMLFYYEYMSPSASVLHVLWRLFTETEALRMRFFS